MNASREGAPVEDSPVVRVTVETHDRIEFAVNLERCK
jgi:hypothetical protein